jgi:hypothetical protein
MYGNRNEPENLFRNIRNIIRVDIIIKNLQLILNF